MNQFLFTLLIFTSVVNMAHIFMYLIGANIYDIKAFKRNHELKESGANTAKNNPLVTVMIPAHNEETGVTKTLNSVCASTYKNLQVIVVDDASTDTTRKVVNRYIEEHPDLPVEFLSIIMNRGKATALNFAIQEKARGEFVMTLDADSVIDKHAIENTLKYFDDPNVAGVAANVKIYHQQSIIALLQMFEHMIGYRSKKFYTLTNSEFIVGGVASTYRHDVLKRVGWYDTDTQTEDIGLSLKITAEGNKANKLVYAEDVIAMTEAVQTTKALFRQRFRWKLGMIQNLLKFGSVVGNTDSAYTRMLTYFRLPMAFLGEVMLLLEPLLFGYILYLSIIYSEPGFFFGAYLTLIIYVSFIVWNDNTMNLARRIQLTAYFPILYFIFYIMNVVQLVAIFRCLANPSKLLRRSKTASTWISPERLGALQAAVS